MNWIDYLVPVSTAGATATGMYVGIIRPRHQEHLRHEAERKKATDELLERRRLRDIAIDGDVGIPGVREAVVPMAVRLEKVEGTMTKVVQTVDALGNWQKEANGTAKNTQRDVAEIHNMIAGIVEAGVLTKLNLDSDANAVATLASESQDALLNAIHQHHEDGSV